MFIASRPLCTFTLGLLTGLAEVGCADHPPDETTITRPGNIFENLSYATHTRVGSCMDDNPDPQPYCM